jgi:hypothetical protein
MRAHGSHIPRAGERSRIRHWQARAFAQDLTASATIVNGQLRRDDARAVLAVGPAPSDYL